MVTEARQKLLITVFGGTGFLGSRLVARLLQAGHRVRIAARAPARRPELLASDLAEAHHADLFKPDTLAAAMDGADAVINATSLYVEQGGLTYEAVHVDGAARLAELARGAGVSRFLQLSDIGSDPNARDSYIRARGQGEEAVRAAFPAATILRSAVMFGKDDALLSAIKNIASRSPVYPLFGAGKTRLQPVWVEDVAEAIARLLEAESGARRYELAGGEIVTYRKLVTRVAKAWQLRTHLFPVPFVAWKPLAIVAERLPGAPLTPAQIALMQVDNVASEKAPGMASLGIEPRGVIDYVRDQAGVGTGPTENT